MPESIQPRPKVPLSWIRDFSPGYFALVMATGIVSLAWHLQGEAAIARILFWVNVPAYLVLWAITLIRWFKFRRELLADLTSHARGAAFLTIVAGSCVLGKQFVLFTSWVWLGKCLWLGAVGLWLILIYSFFAAVTLAEPKPTLETGISGTWLLAVVATESLCTLGTMVAASFARPELVLFVSLLAFLLGAMFYVVLITLILYRWSFRSMDPKMLTPPYWINMGALAITTLAGGRLLLASQTNPILTAYQPFITGATIGFWSTATWWIPLLVIVGFWRHGWQKLPLQYDAQYWSLVFPLGMYSVATFVLADVLKLSFLGPIALFFGIAALGAWAVTMIGLIRSLPFWRHSEE